jgi:type IV pilus assembly protein PilA
MKLLKRRGGFTLIELMIVVAIIGILAAIAIPNFMRFQLKAKAGEGKTNLAAIRTAEESYMAEFGTYIAQVTAIPVTAPLSMKVEWPRGGGGGFSTIGWAPEGAVYYQYAAATGLSGTDFLAEALSNIDNGDPNGDGIQNQWAYVKPVAGASSSVAAAGLTACPSTGVWDPIAMLPTLLETVGPCDSASGNSEF